MISSRFYRSVPGLMAACTLMLSLVLQQGCTFLEKHFGDPENFSNRPALVMFVNPDHITKDRAHITIEMSKIHIGDISLVKILGHARDWRLNVFTFNGSYLDGKDDYSREGLEEPLHLQNLLVDKLMRVDVDYHPGSSSDGPKAELRTKSFLVLLHKYPEDECCSK